MNLITKSQVKQIVGDVSISSDFFPALNQEVENLIKKALYRAKANNRRTLMARDL